MTTSTTPNSLPLRGAGILAILSGIGAFVLFAAHPGDSVRDLAGIIRSEAANKLLDALVHGGFIVVMCVQLACYSVLFARLGIRRLAAILGLALFAFGAAFLSGSLLIDGLIQPFVATVYVTAPAKIEFARGLFVLMQAFVATLMPLGLAFQSAAMAAFGWALSASGLSRLAGAYGILAGTIFVAALAANTVLRGPFTVIGAIVATQIWAIAVGAVLWRNRPDAPTS